MENTQRSIAFYQYAQKRQQVKKKVTNFWLTTFIWIFTHIHPAKHVTPYMHCMMQHVGEFMNTSGALMPLQKKYNDTIIFVLHSTKYKSV